jgi:3-oxoacyl-(acyl-carrier-protein) synthase
MVHLKPEHILCLVKEMAVSARRVVVTGLGLVTPLGLNVETSWSHLIQGKSGIVSLKGYVDAGTGHGYNDIPSKVAALVQKDAQLFQHRFTRSVYPSCLL